MRASQIPLASKCRKSPSLNTGFGSTHSNLGNAFHEAARNRVLNIENDFDSIKTRFGLSDKDINGIKSALWNIEIKIPTGAIVFADDQKLSAFNGAITGTPDLAIIETAKKCATVIDWKSGWADVEDPESNLQTISYLILIHEKCRELGLIEIETFNAMIVLPRTNSIKAYSFNTMQISKLISDVLAIVDESASPDAEYTTGAHCTFCYGCMGCPAFAGEITRFVKLISDPNATMPINSVDVLKIALPFAKTMTTVSGKIEAVAKAYVDQNGKLDLGGGMTYAKYIEPREKIDPVKAMPVLELFFKDKAVGLMSISKTAVTEAAQEAGRGVSTKVFTQLKEAGAIKEEQSIAYRIKKGANNESAKISDGK